MFKAVNASPEKTILRLSYLQLVLYLATWLVGIYINGFVPSPSDTGGSTVSLFLSHAVITHFVLGAMTASVGIMLLSFGWVYRLRRFTMFTGLSLASIAIAGTGGLSFVFGIGDSSLDSMIMATSFITAVYLSFFAILNTGASRRMLVRGSSIVQNLSVAALAFFYVVFVSGIYLNLYVASSVFSEPPAIAQKMLGNMVTSPAALFHEGSGTLLFLFTIMFTVALFRSGLTKLALRGLLGCLLVLYSLLEGVTQNIVPLFVSTSNSILNTQNGVYYTVTSEVLPLLSAAGFLAAIIIVMTVTQSLVRTVPPRQRMNQ